MKHYTRPILHAKIRSYLTYSFLISPPFNTVNYWEKQSPYKIKGKLPQQEG